MCRYGSAASAGRARKTSKLRDAGVRKSSRRRWLAVQASNYSQEVISSSVPNECRSRSAPVPMIPNFRTCSQRASRIRQGRPPWAWGSAARGLPEGEKPPWVNRTEVTTVGPEFNDVFWLTSMEAPSRLLRVVGRTIAMTASVRSLILLALIAISALTVSSLELRISEARAASSAGPRCPPGC